MFIYAGYISEYPCSFIYSHFQVNGEVGENGLDADITATTKGLGELQFEEEDDEAYYNKVWSSSLLYALMY